jgi:ribosome biogenesis GTPase
MTGTVYKSTGSWYVVKDDSGEIYQARIKGIFRMDKLTSTNPLAVGDKVAFEIENELEKSVMITEIFPRRNYINRKSPSHRLHHHIVASNLDQCMLFATLKEPKTSQGFIDRFLIAAESYQIPAIVVFNKFDIYRDKEMEKFEVMRSNYEAVGYKVLKISVKEKTGLSEVMSLLNKKSTLISGHSGVGKSSFINYLLPDLALRTKDVSGWSGKGLHTTTFAEMFDLPEGGCIIDTPGIREFGLVDIEKTELSHYFPEMRQFLHLCQFNNCLHFNEQDCAVKEAVEKEIISIDRYVSYLTIMETIETKTY